jgi:hypothetical protein
MTPRWPRRHLQSSPSLWLPVIRPHLPFNQPNHQRHLPLARNPLISRLCQSLGALERGLSAGTLAPPDHAGRSLSATLQPSTTHAPLRTQRMLVVHLLNWFLLLGNATNFKLSLVLDGAVTPNRAGAATETGCALLLQTHLVRHTWYGTPGTAPLVRHTWYGTPGTATEMVGLLPHTLVVRQPKWMVGRPDLQVRKTTSRTKTCS